jgi:VWFA-related protein
MHRLMSTTSYLLQAIVLLGVASGVAQGDPPKDSLRVHALGTTVATIENSSVRVKADAVGNFVMETASGVALLYEYGSPGTSGTTLSVDGTETWNFEDQALGNEVQAVQVSGGTIVGKWQVGDIELSEMLALVRSSTTGNFDTMEIRWTVRNTGSSSHSVGCRVMLDTMLGSNDGAPLRVPGVGSVIAEAEWNGSSVPPYFEAFDDLANPSVVSHGTLIGGSAVQPDRVVAAYWGHINDTPWSFQANSAWSITSDSAVGIYWDPRNLAPGVSRTYRTYYGLGRVAADVQPPLVSGLSAPATVDCISNALTPNPFTITLYLSNTANGVTQTATNVSATLTLPVGLTLAAGTARIDLPDIPLNGSSQCSWQVSVAGGTSGAKNFSVQIAASSTSKQMTGTVTIPTCAACTPPHLTLSQVDTSACPAVKSIISVTDASGQPVTGLTTSNFCLSEDGTSQSITVAPASSSGGNLFVAIDIDNTGSLGSTAFADEEAAAKALIALLGSSDQAAIYGFTGAVELVQNFTSSKTALNAAIDAYPYKSGGSTNFFDAVYASLTNTAAKTGRKAVIAMTDGLDNSSSHTEQQLIDYARQLGVPVITIGFGAADASVLQDIATQTGGSYYDSASSSNLQQILQLIGSVLNNQYVVSYTSSRADGQSHALDLCVTVNGCTQHAQGSFNCVSSQGQCVTKSSSCGGTVTGSISSSDCQSSPRGSGKYAQRITLPAIAGQTVTITATWSGFDGYLILADPTGAVVEENDDYQSTAYSRIENRTLATSGTYVIWVTTYSGGAAGTYSIQIDCASALPTCAGSPSPADGATGVPTTSLLSWGAVAGATSYDIHGGTSSITPLPLLATVTNPTYNPSTLSANQDYWWQVVAKNSSGAASGCPVWHFRTASPAAAALNISAVTASGSSACVGLSLVYSGTPNIVSLTTDITYEPTKLTPTGVTTPIAGKVAQGNSVSSGIYRVTVYGGSSAFPAGTVASACFTLASGFQQGTTQLGHASGTPTASDASANSVPITGAPGSITAQTLRKAGDCNGDGAVSITELQQVINNQLGISTTGCGDCDGSGGSPTITEVQKAVNCQLGLASCAATCIH